MTSEGNVIVIDDDDEVQIIGSKVKEKAKIQVYIRAEDNLPATANGHLRPVLHFTKMITKALATCPQKRATVNMICEIIAHNMPYFKHCPRSWVRFIKSTLNKRKKFFFKAGTNDRNEDIWMFNPSFADFMISKSVSCGEQDTSQSKGTAESQQASSSAATANSRPTIIMHSQSVRPVSPIFVCSGRTESASDTLIPENNLEEPTYTYTPPEIVLDSDTQTETSDPICTITDPSSITKASFAKQPENQDNNIPAPQLQPKVINETVRGAPSSTITRPAEAQGHPAQVTDDNGLGKITSDRISDFNLHNLLYKNIIEDEIQFRLSFYKEHKGVSKFRLHCTVCDTHLGTSGVTARFNVRFHSRLGVLVCLTCYLRTMPPLPTSTSCHWCGQLNGVIHNCSSCNSKFCEKCMIRNFGGWWFRQVFYPKRLLWKCFYCDLRLIWPHRAIAYYLYHHYKDLKRKNLELPGKYSSMYKIDISHCCKSPKRVQPSSLEQHQPTISLSSDCIFLQAPMASSVTVNTGTQYIHNVYPGKRYAGPRHNGSISGNHKQVSQQSTSKPSSINNFDPSTSRHPESSTSKVNHNSDKQSTQQIPKSNTSQEMAEVTNPEGFFIINNTDPSEVICSDVNIPVSEDLTDKPLSKPMPKSKKQSLLRTVLMNESIESMRKHFDTQPSVSSVPSDGTIGSSEAQYSSCTSEKTMGAETTTEPNSHFNLQDTPTEPQNCPTFTPKIKIRTLQELQQCSMVDITHPNNINETSGSNHESIENMEDKGIEDETVEDINLLPLKGGILNSCQTLLSTQKQFRELALDISKNVTYKPEKAKVLINNFLDTLNKCQNNLQLIDKNVKTAFPNLIPNANMDSILKCIAKTNKKANLRKNGRKKCHKLTPKITKPTTTNLMDSHFTADNGNVITVDNQQLNVTQSNIHPESSTKASSSRGKKKRCMWDDKRRKRKCRRKAWSKRVYESIKEKQPEVDNYCDERKLNIKQEETNDNDSQFNMSENGFPTSDEFRANLIKTHLKRFKIKPCSILLHTLDPIIVQLLQSGSATILY